MATSRALKMSQEAGDPHEIVQMVEAPRPKPGPGQVLVRIVLRTLHPTDLLFVRLGYRQVSRLGGLEYNPEAKIEVGVVPGFDGFGVVEEVGKGVSTVRVGQRVTPCLYSNLVRTGTQGSWQDFILAAEEDVYVIPETIDDSTAAQLIVNPWTAYLLLKTLAAPPGEYIISSAAGSVVGRLIIQLAKHWGVKTINIVRHDAYTAELSSLGADVVINSSKEDIVTKVREVTDGRGAYGALDAVGGDLTKSLASAVRDGGEVLVYGVLSGYDVTVGVMDLARGVKLGWWSLFPRTKTKEQREEVGREVIRLFDQRVWQPLKFGQKFKLEDFKRAFRAVETQNNGGKVLLGE